MKDQEMDSQETKFAQLVEEQKSTIYTVCYMFSKDQDEVSDLFQEVLVNLWKSFPTFEGRSDIRTWVYRVAMNVCVSLDRKKKRRDTVPLTMDINPYEDENPNSKQMEMLRKRISLLGPFDRAIIMLWLENMSYDEIAAVVGISVKNVSVRLYRIKEELKKMK
jgi:RNA polymerase sigma-70 factor (ECF subfamily)